MNNKYNEQAMKIIDARRNKAELESEMRYNKIVKDIPEIASINQQLCDTGKKMIKIIHDGKNIIEKVAELQKFNERCQELKTKYLVDNGYPADYLETHYYCDLCEDTGKYNNGRCKCMNDICKKLAVEDMNKTAHINLTTFDNFNLDYYGKDDGIAGTPRETMNLIYRYCRNYADNFTDNSESILMFGRTGLGKTHLSLSIASEVLTKGYSVLYDSTINLLSKIEKEHFGRVTDSDTLSVIFDSDLVILDDLGTEFDTQFNVSAIFNIIDTRINRNKPTIVSTNLSIEDIKRKYEERIVSRLFASYRCLEFAGEDVRQIKRRLKK